MSQYEEDKLERIKFFEEIEDDLTEIRQKIRYMFPNFNSLVELDRLMQNMIKTNQLLSKVQDWVRE